MLTAVVHGYYRLSNNYYNSTHSYYKVSSGITKTTYNYLLLLHGLIRDSEGKEKAIHKIYSDSAKKAEAMNEHVDFISVFSMINQGYSNCRGGNLADTHKKQKLHRAFMVKLQQNEW